MNSRASTARDVIAVITLKGNIQTQVEESTLHGILEELPGVHGVEFPGDTITVRFDPQTIDPCRFGRAVLGAGFVARGFELIHQGSSLPAHPLDF